MGADVVDRAGPVEAGEVVDLEQRLQARAGRAGQANATRISGISC